jgi:hypothetical protein
MATGKGKRRLGIVGERKAGRLEGPIRPQQPVPDQRQHRAAEQIRIAGPHPKPTMIGRPAELGYLLNWLGGHD